MYVLDTYLDRMLSRKTSTRLVADGWEKVGDDGEAATGARSPVGVVGLIRRRELKVEKVEQSWTCKNPHVSQSQPWDFQQRKEVHVISPTHHNCMYQNTFAYGLSWAQEQRRVSVVSPTMLSFMQSLVSAFVWLFLLFRPCTISRRALPFICVASQALRLTILTDICS